MSPLRYWEAWRVAPNSQTITPVATDTFQWAPGLANGCTNDTVRFDGTARFHNNVAALPFERRPSERIFMANLPIRTSVGPASVYFAVSPDNREVRIARVHPESAR